MFSTIGNSRKEIPNIGDHGMRLLVQLLVRVRQGVKGGLRNRGARLAPVVIFTPVGIAVQIHMDPADQGPVLVNGALTLPQKGARRLFGETIRVTADPVFKLDRNDTGFLADVVGLDPGNLDGQVATVRTAFPAGNMVARIGKQGFGGF